MTNNLKIEVLVSNIPEDGSIASQFPSQEYVNQQLAKKANLSPEGRLDPAQAPDYTEIPGLYEHIEDTKDAIETSIADSLQDAKGYTNQQLSTGLQTKADLVNGKIPFDQIPFSADIEDQIQINVENITAVVDQKVAQVVEQVNGVATAANSYTDTKVAENKTYVDTTVGNVIEDVTTIIDTKTVSKNVTIPTYLTPEAGVAAGTGVAAGAYFNVRSTEDDTALVEYQNVGGAPTPSGKSYPSAAYVQNVAKHTALPFVAGKTYSLNEHVQLESGDTVVSLVANNAANPNSDMTGWINTRSAEYILTEDGDSVEQKTNGIKSRLRKTPYDFGAKGGTNDDTQAVIDCINSGDDFEINDSHLVQPFEITDLHLNGNFTSKGKLRIESTSLVDLVVFRRCSGELHNPNVEAAYSSGSYATLVFDWCEDLNIYRPKIKNGKIIGLCVQNSTNTHVYNGKGEAETSQSWYLISCIDSTMSYCKLKNTGSGFYIIGAGYKSGTVQRSQIPEQDSIGMAFRYCFADVNNLGFDINGAVGAEFYKCIATQRWSDTQSACFQVKQSTNIPEETKRLTQKNKVIGCLALQCNRGFSTQNGEDVLFKDNYIFGSKHNGIILNDTPRVTIDGLYCFDLFQQNVSSPAIDTGSRAGIVFAKNTSSNCIVRNVRLYQSVIPEDITKISLFEFDGTNCSIDDVMVNTSGAIDSSPNKFANFCVNNGLHFTYGSKLKVGLAANYNKVIDDQTSTAIYPLVFSKQIDLATAATGTEYFDAIPERGLIVGKVRFSVIGTPANSKIGVGDQSSVVRTLGLTDVVAGVNDYAPSNQIIAQSLALAMRREISGTGAGRLFVQMRGISLY